MKYIVKRGEDTVTYGLYKRQWGKCMKIGVREVVTFAGMQFNIQTLEMTWLAMAIVILIAFLATRSLKLVPSGWQNVIEMVIVWLNEQIGVTLGSRGQLVAPFLITLFLFLLISNWIGLIPTLASPTNDLNTTLGLALLVIVMLHVLGLYYKGFNYIKHFFPASSAICNYQFD